MYDTPDTDASQEVVESQGPQSPSMTRRNAYKKTHPLAPHPDTEDSVQ
ncbi:hypothetical protein KDH_32970 [Dictyobacter sp. S3.2.2.5]|uniref:Uncharacterized protein n=1 Tax=Dictyobacter halimunensis TaxID=3026934 RepID=A0ABQ6FS79_9CHLR|nr:hypothetical protein KDH_32970 [Dictyobacter sp. S3.2.2.5]